VERERKQRQSVGGKPADAERTEPPTAKRSKTTTSRELQRKGSLERSERKPTVSTGRGQTATASHAEGGQREVTSSDVTPWKVRRHPGERKESEGLAGTDTPLSRRQSGLGATIDDATVSRLPISPDLPGDDEPELPEELKEREQRRGETEGFEGELEGEPTPQGRSSPWNWEFEEGKQGVSVQQTGTVEALCFRRFNMIDTDRCAEYTIDGEITPRLLTDSSQYSHDTVLEITARIEGEVREPHPADVLYTGPRTEDDLEPEEREAIDNHPDFEIEDWTHLTTEQSAVVRRAWALTETGDIIPAAVRGAQSGVGDSGLLTVEASFDQDTPTENIQTINAQQGVTSTGHIEYDIDATESRISAGEIKPNIPNIATFIQAYSSVTQGGVSDHRFHNVRAVPVRNGASEKHGDQRQNTGRENAGHLAQTTDSDHTTDRTQAADSKRDGPARGGVARDTDDTAAGGTLDGATESLVRGAVATGGRKLSREVRSFFEPRLGVDLSGVRAHTDDEADEATRRIDAEAYTLGTDIAFRSGAYEPTTEEGKQLLGHELAHVVQQRTGGVSRQSADIHRQFMPVEERPGYEPPDQDTSETDRDHTSETDRDQQSGPETGQTGRDDERESGPETGQTGRAVEIGADSGWSWDIHNVAQKDPESVLPMEIEDRVTLDEVCFHRFGVWESDVCTELRYRMLIDASAKENGSIARVSARMESMALEPKPAGAGPLGMVIPFARSEIPKWKEAQYIQKYGDDWREKFEDWAYEKPTAVAQDLGEWSLDGNGTIVPRTQPTGDRQRDDTLQSQARIGIRGSRRVDPEGRAQPESHLVTTVDLNTLYEAKKGVTRVFVVDLKYVGAARVRVTEKPIGGNETGSIDIKFVGTPDETSSDSDDRATATEPDSGTESDGHKHVGDQDTQETPPGEHTVVTRRGQNPPTLSEIGCTHDVHWRVLQLYNDIANPDSPGWKIYIPQDPAVLTTYYRRAARTFDEFETVSYVRDREAGEGLEEIGTQCGVPWQLIQEYNDIENPHSFPDERLEIPAVDRSACSYDCVSPVSTTPKQSEGTSERDQQVTDTRDTSERDQQVTDTRDTSERDQQVTDTGERGSEPTMSGPTEEYVVKPGDTLGHIADLFGVSDIEELTAANDIEDESTISAGEAITIPAELRKEDRDTGKPDPGAGETTTYRVKPGDTLRAIAIRFGVPFRRLWLSNWDVVGANPHIIRQGVELDIPRDGAGNRKGTGTTRPQETSETREKSQEQTHQQSWKWRLDAVGRDEQNLGDALPIVVRDTVELEQLCFRRLGLIKTDKCAELDYDVRLDGTIENDGKTARIESAIDATMTEPRSAPTPLNAHTRREFYEFEGNLKEAYIEEHGEDAYEEMLVKKRSVSVSDEAEWELLEDGSIHQTIAGQTDRERNSGLTAEAIAKAVGTNEQIETANGTISALLGRAGFQLLVQAVEMEGQNYVLDLKRFAGVNSQSNVALAGTQTQNTIDIKFAGIPSSRAACEDCAESE